MLLTVGSALSQRREEGKGGLVGESHRPEASFDKSQHLVKRFPDTRRDAVLPNLLLIFPLLSDEGVQELLRLRSHMYLGAGGLPAMPPLLWSHAGLVLECHYACRSITQA